MIPPLNSNLLEPPIVQSFPSPLVHPSVVRRAFLFLFPIRQQSIGVPCPHNHIFCQLIFSFPTFFIPSSTSPTEVLRTLPVNHTLHCRVQFFITMTCRLTFNLKYDLMSHLSRLIFNYDNCTNLEKKSIGKLWRISCNWKLSSWANIFQNGRNIGKFNKNCTFSLKVNSDKNLYLVDVCQFS